MTILKTMRKNIMLVVFCVLAAGLGVYYLITPDEQIILKAIDEPTQEIKILNEIQNSPPLEFVNEPEELPEQTIDLNSLALEIFDKVNQQRSSMGSNSLSWNSQIASVAESHSLDMMNRNYFAHASPEGVNSDQRGINAGFPICGDSQTIQLQQTVEQTGSEYDIMLADYEARKAKLEQDIYYRDNFGQNNIGLTNQINQEYQELEALGQELDRRVIEINNNIIILNERAEAGFVSSGFGENLASFTGYSQNQIADKAIQGWLDSPPHKENMLLPYWTMAGIGVSYNQDLNRYIVTNDFC